MLASGASWLAGQLKTAAGSTVVYVRGNHAVEVTATIGSSAFEAANQSGVVERWESRDFLIATSDLPFGDPVQGDKIVEQINGVSVTYAVSTPRGVPPWHYADGFRLIVRVHTTQSDSGVTYIATEGGDLLIA
jgi:hypothetical protein